MDTQDETKATNENVYSEPVIKCELTWSEWMEISEHINSIINPTVRYLPGENLKMAEEAVKACKESAHFIKIAFSTQINAAKIIDSLAIG